MAYGPSARELGGIDHVLADCAADFAAGDRNVYVRVLGQLEDSHDLHTDIDETNSKL